MKIRILLSGILLMAVFFLPALSAQERDPQVSTVSNLNRSTFGIFRNDVDSIIDVNYFSTIDMEKRFAFTGAAYNQNNPTFSAGYAQRLGNNYLGLFYNGSMWFGNSNTYFTTTGGTTLQQDPADTGITWDNTFAILFGNEVLGGIKLDIGILGLDKDTDLVETTTTDSVKTVTTTGAMNFGLTWGHSLNMGSIVFKPKIGAAYYLDMNKIETETTTAAGTDTDTEYGYYSGATFYGTRSILQAIAGVAFESVKEDNSVSVFSADYRLLYYFYPDFYEENKLAAGGDPTIGTNDGSKDMRHYINLRYKKTFTVSERFSAGFSIDGQAVIFSQETADVTKVGSTILNEEPVIKEFSMTIRPSVSGAFMYWVKPEVFSLNAGFSLRIPTYTYTSEEENDEAADIVTTTKTHTWDGFSTTVSAGATFNINEYFAFDLCSYFNIGNNNARNSYIDLSRISLIATLKM
ncbi:hypothetical protein K7I13_15060 [Brucepastera parasyntrophica]|uniref:TDE2508 family outer membrane beta-barrel protein n=1 Tax=Brucepastera parasyntrophica TaxID=2880008 RepID=UPI002109B7FE|nr:hypothetical protein [Brucepastera parasyntrophica]ULQ59749.1 hypothetical protein K7I13_15060 [Brucepastera parasyntrophica]